MASKSPKPRKFRYVPDFDFKCQEFLKSRTSGPGIQEFSQNPGMHSTRLIPNQDERCRAQYICQQSTLHRSTYNVGYSVRRSLCWNTYVRWVKVSKTPSRPSIKCASSAYVIERHCIQSACDNESLFAQTSALSIFCDSDIDYSRSIGSRCSALNTFNSRPLCQLEKYLVHSCKHILVVKKNHICVSTLAYEKQRKTLCDVK